MGGLDSIETLVGRYFDVIKRLGLVWLVGLCSGLDFALCNILDPALYFQFPSFPCGPWSNCYSLVFPSSPTQGDTERKLHDFSSRSRSISLPNYQNGFRDRGKHHGARACVRRGCTAGLPRIEYHHNWDVDRHDLATLGACCPGLHCVLSCRKPGGTPGPTR